MSKRTAAIISTTLAVLGFGLVTAPTASAAGYGCSGSLVGNYQVLSGSESFGNLYVYYNSSTGGNCAVTVSNSSHGYGSSKYMSVDIRKCIETDDHGVCTPYSNSVEDEDSGNFTQYAGPVSVNAAGHCIMIGGQINWQGRTGLAFEIGHCG